MDELFKSYCCFGAKDAAPLMDNAKFAKFARETGILDKKLTATDIDIIFSKVKGGPSERKIAFKQFQEALKMLAEKKYGSASDVGKLEEAILKTGGPKTSRATQIVAAGGVDRLTDTSKYTGSHRERFGDDGKGKGMDGRHDIPDADVQAGYVRGYKGGNTYDKKE